MSERPGVFTGFGSKQAAVWEIKSIESIGCPDVIQTGQGVESVTSSSGSRGFSSGSIVEEEVLMHDAIDNYLTFKDALPREEEKTVMLLRAIRLNQSQVRTYMKVLGVTPQRMREIDAQLRERLGM